MLVEGAVKQESRNGIHPLGLPLPLNGTYFQKGALVPPMLLPTLPPTPVKETSQVYLEYDRVTRRRVLNTYEILLEIGRGEHGKVKLAKDLSLNQLVAIKIISRRTKRHQFDHLPLSLGDKKVKREISIMKRCHHRHIVRLREVLDDDNASKIYLVLEYLEKGEIKWKRTEDISSNMSATIVNGVAQPLALSTPIEAIDIPCCRDLNEADLLDDNYSPNLLFVQLRKAFRHVVLGLEYLHMQGIVHRDIKPANLLVLASNCVKISDFGVSLLIANGSGEIDLVKTAGTPAFYAPELCLDTTNHPLTYKIDIWALGVTLYCLLLGRVPFNAPTEWELFEVICSKQPQFPTYDHLITVAPVAENEYELAKDLLRRLLEKDPKKRIEIDDIKTHPFTLLGCSDPQAFQEYNSKVVMCPARGEDPVGVGAVAFGGSLGPHQMLMLESLHTTTPPPIGTFAGKRPSATGALLEGTRARGSSDLLLRRGLVEACQIETMRNARGDVYLSSTPVLATIKGIQEKDDKRRKLSIFSTRMLTPVNCRLPLVASNESASRQLSTGSIHGTPATVASAPHIPTIATPIAVPAKVPMVVDGLPAQRRLRPSSGIVDGHQVVAQYFASHMCPAVSMPVPGHLATPTLATLTSLVMLLPLLELFALLDSLDETAIDNYLSQCLSNTLGVHPVTQPLSQVSPSPFAAVNTSNITEKLRTFNLNMGQKNRDKDRGVGPRNDPQEYSSSDLDSDLDDEGGATFKFSSKLTPQHRPVFLNETRRAASQDIIGTKTGKGMPVVIHELSTPVPELADVPMGLFGDSMPTVVMPQLDPTPDPVIFLMPALPLAQAGRVPQVRLPLAREFKTQYFSPGKFSLNSSRRSLVGRPSLTRSNLVNVALLDRELSRDG